MLLSLVLAVTSANAATDYSALFSQAPATHQDLLPGVRHLDIAKPLRLGETVTIWADGASVAVVSAVGEDGLAGADYIDEHDPTYTLVLHVFSVDDPGERRSQIILTTTAEHASPVIRWAGDVDGDGCPDLLLDADTSSAMYLSSRALDGELVGVLRSG
jgi:hypothetical protein